MPLPSFVIEPIFEELVSGSRPLRDILRERRIAPRAFHSTLRRDPELAKGYMIAKQMQIDLLFDLAAVDQMAPAEYAQLRQRLAHLPPQKNWEDEAIKYRRDQKTRARKENIRWLERWKEKDGAKRHRARRHAAAVAALPRRAVTIDDFKAADDLIDIFRLRRAGMFRADGSWVSLPASAERPNVERILVAPFRLQVHFKNRARPQSLPIEWVWTAIYTRPYFRCECGRRALKLYWAGGSYCCRHCALGGDATRYRSSSKWRSPNRPRVPGAYRSWTPRCPASRPCNRAVCLGEPAPSRPLRPSPRTFERTAARAEFIGADYRPSAIRARRLGTERVR